MLFKLFNILVSLKKDINNILVKKLNVLVIMYLDNIFIYTKNLG